MSREVVSSLLSIKAALILDLTFMGSSYIVLHLLVVKQTGTDAEEMREVVQL